MKIAVDFDPSKNSWRVIGVDVYSDGVEYRYVEYMQNSEKHSQEFADSLSVLIRCMLKAMARTRERIENG